jgi:hypothetical protein
VIKPLMFFFEYKLACARNLWRRSFLQYGWKFLFYRLSVKKMVWCRRSLELLKNVDWKSKKLKIFLQSCFK